MTSYRPVDSKREEFRKYLERDGVMESLTRVLVSLYEEQDKGIDALEYVQSHLLDSSPSKNATEEELRAEVSRLVSENKMLRKRLSQYEEVPPTLPVSIPSKSQSLQRTEGGSDHSGRSKSSGSARSNPASDKNADQHPSVSSSQKE